MYDFTSLSYIDVKAYNITVRMLYTVEIYPYVVAINGIKTDLPFFSKHINISNQGGSIVYSTDFGLKIIFSNREYTILLCDIYAGYVCGLCGNADGYSSRLNFIILIRYL